MMEGLLTLADSGIGLTTTASMSIVGAQVLGEFAEDGAHLLNATRFASRAKVFQETLAKGTPFLSRVSMVGSLWMGSRAVGRLIDRDRPFEWQDLSMVASSLLTSSALYFRRSGQPRARFLLMGAGLLLDLVDLGYCFYSGKSWGEIGIQAGTLVVFNADRGSRRAFLSLAKRPLVSSLSRSCETRPAPARDFALVQGFPARNRSLSKVGLRQVLGPSERRARGCLEQRGSTVYFRDLSPLHQRERVMATMVLVEGEGRADGTLEELAAWAVIHAMARRPSDHRRTYAGGGEERLAAPRRRRDPDDPVRDSRDDPVDPPEPHRDEVPRDAVDPWNTGHLIHHEVSTRLKDIGVVQVDRLVEIIHEWKAAGQDSFWLMQALKEVAFHHPEESVRSYAGLMLQRIEAAQSQSRRHERFMADLAQNVKYDLRAVMERIDDTLNAQQVDLAEETVRWLIANGNRSTHQALLNDTRPAVRALAYRTYRKVGKADLVRELWVSREKDRVKEVLDGNDLTEREEALWIVAEAAIAGVEEARMILVRYAYEFDSELQPIAEELIVIASRFVSRAAAN